MLQIKADQTSRIAQLLQDGAVIAMPTETVYGLAVSAAHQTAIHKLSQIKERDLASGKFFTLVPENIVKIKEYVIINQTAQRLIQQHFPGALTLILPKNPAFQNPYFDQLQHIGIRIPDYPLFAQLLPLTGPLLLTSANRKGKEPLQTPAQIDQALPEIDAIVIGQPGHQPPSTIIDCTDDHPKVIRQGSLKVV